MLKIKTLFKSHKNVSVPEYEEYLTLYSAQFANMTNEQLQEEYKTINTSGLSVMQKLAKANSLNTEFKQRGLK